jgi:hypothetical protein
MPKRGVGCRIARQKNKKAKFMEEGHLSEAWRDLYVMLGSSSAALIGLLFVATSLHLKEIVNNSGYRTRSRNLTFHLVAMLVQAAAILTPQPLAALGAELIVINLCGLWLPLSFVYTTHLRDRSAAKRSGLSIYRALTYVAGYSLGIGGGAALIGRSNWGMFPVTLAYVTFLVAVIWNAWLLMVGVGQAPAKAPAAKRGAAGKPAHK